MEYTIFVSRPESSSSKYVCKTAFTERARKLFTLSAKKNCFPIENWLTKRQTTDQIDERKLFNKSNEKIEKSEKKNPAEMHTHTITS